MPRSSRRYPLSCAPDLAASNAWQDRRNFLEVAHHIAPLGGDFPEVAEDPGGTSEGAGQETAGTLVEQTDVRT
jgi:hypothetical protein